MITINETTLQSEVEPSQKWAEPFADLLDEIYYPGYAISLAEESPVAYQREFWYFVETYT